MSSRKISWLSNKLAFSLISKKLKHKTECEANKQLIPSSSVPTNNMIRLKHAINVRRESWKVLGRAVLACEYFQTIFFPDPNIGSFCIAINESLVLDDVKSNRQMSRSEMCHYTHRQHALVETFKKTSSSWLGPVIKPQLVSIACLWIDVFGVEVEIIC